ncbi:hypothetical protein [Roseibium sp. M-1]
MNGKLDNRRTLSPQRLAAVPFVALAMVLSLVNPGQAARNTALEILPGDNPFMELPVPEDTFRTLQTPRTNAIEQQIAFADDLTQAIVLQLQRGTAECNSLNPAYRIDCLRQVYSRAAGAAGNRPDYAAAANELRRLSRTLNGIVRQNQDTKAGQLKKGGRSYKAVVSSALRKANGQAAQAIQETTTKLLRSAGNSQKRKVHYTRIANAVNSTKKILRS